MFLVVYGSLKLHSHRKNAAMLRMSFMSIRLPPVTSHGKSQLRSPGSARNAAAAARMSFMSTMWSLFMSCKP